MGAPPVPNVLAMLLCDQLIIDAQTQKKSLIGIFDNFNAASYPAVLACAVFTKLADAEGPYTFKIKIVNLKDDTLLGEISAPGKIQTLLEPADVAVYINIIIPEAGKYEFQFLANEVYLTRITVSAKVIGPQPWPQP